MRAVQDELAKIDVGLSTDVKFLRDSIEQASLDFMAAQYVNFNYSCDNFLRRANCRKRYDKAEKEFVSAKLHLHKSAEKKEMLTEHLAAIIEKNEERKAQKLADLMKELDIAGEHGNEE